VHRITTTYVCSFQCWGGRWNCIGGRGKIAASSSRTLHATLLMEVAGIAEQKEWKEWNKEGRKKVSPYYNCPTLHAGRYPEKQVLQKFPGSRVFPNWKKKGSKPRKEKGKKYVSCFFCVQEAGVTLVRHIWVQRQVPEPIMQESGIGGSDPKTEAGTVGKVRR
jgi:hypothetical protein